KLAEIAVFQCGDLPRGQLQLLGDGGDRKTCGLAARTQQRACRRGVLRREVMDQRVGAIGHSQPPITMVLASAESGYRLRSCEMYEASALRSPSLRSMHAPSASASGGGLFC